MSFYDFTVKAADGSEYSFNQLKGKPVLVVNTASKCGFTPQYEGLEELYKTYKGKGLVIIGFPCDQFAHQEPGSDSDIQQFCSLNYGVTFPVMAKIEVNGDKASSLYVWLKEQAKGVLGSAIKWNFTKFLISKDGEHVKRFAPTVIPKDLVNDIEQAL